MNIELLAFLHFTRCPQIYALVDVQGVSMLPTVRECVGNVVRRAIADELQHRIEHGDTMDGLRSRTHVIELSESMMLQDIAYTEAESQRGVRHAINYVSLQALKLVALWRAVVEPRISPVSVNKPFTFSGENGHTLSGFIETEEAGNVRLTRVRWRRPAKNEAQYDLSVALQGGCNTAIVDYLIDAKPLVVDRQTVEYSPAKLQAIRERLNVMVQCIEAGTFPPTDTKYWRCAQCGLRSCCRYVG